MLALAVTAVHIADQGGVIAFTAPDWIGCGYRLIEAGGVVTVSLFVEAALMVLSVSMLRALRQSANPAGPRARIGWPRSGANHIGVAHRTWN
jgi:hypothetical protein